MKKISIILAIIIASGALLNLKADSPRKVLYEKFTNASCPPCAAQDPFYKGYLKNPATKEILIPVAYHVNYPGSDVINALNNTISSARNTYYAVDGVPSGRASGILHPASPQWYAGAPGDTNSIKNVVANYRGQMSPIDFNISQVNNGREVSATVEVTSSTALNNKFLHILFVERYFAHPNAGTNGQKSFEYVVREMSVDNSRNATGRIINLAATESLTFNEKWTVPSQANPDQIFIVAFVQDNDNKEVLQAGWNLVEAPSMIVSSDSKYSTADRNTTTSKKITISNPTNTPVTVSAKLEENMGSLHQNADVELNTTSFNLNANESKEVELSFTNGSKGGYSDVAVTISTVGAGISLPQTEEFGFLSKGTKYVVYTGFNGFVKDAYTGISSNPDYMDETAFITMFGGPEYFPTEKVFLAENFDVSIISLGTYPLAFANDAHNIGALATTILNSGKHVYVSSLAGMYFTFNPQGSGQVGNPPASRNFYETMLGLQFTNNVNRNDGQRYTTFTINGVMNDPIGKGLSLPANSFPQNDPTLRTIQGTPYTDVFSISPNSRSNPIFYYNGIQNDVAGIRYTSPTTGARLVYTSFAIEALGSKALRDATMKDIMDWLVNGNPTSVAQNIVTGVSMMPNPASIFSTINFTSESNQTVTISVIDVQGKVVSTNEITNPTVGTNSFSLMTSKLTNGSYTVVVKQGENVTTTPLVVMN